MSDIPTAQYADQAAEIERLRGEVRSLKRQLSAAARHRDHRREGRERLLRRRLKALVEITNELSMASNRDSLCRRAVELARERLDFDCLGIWFRTRDPEVIVGSYGVDDAGNLCDERGKRSRIGRDSPERRLHISGEPMVLQRDVPVCDTDGRVKGLASQVFVAIWDGTRVIGHISMDNRVSGVPLSEPQCELLRLFGSAIGYLCARKEVEDEREALIEDLRSALDRIKVLSGLVPICSCCKKIRDDGGYWNQLEEFIQEHSDAEFSHGLCPDCAERLYPELYPPPPRVEAGD